jgi:hypothetical protein
VARLARKENIVQSHEVLGRGMEDEPELRGDRARNVHLHGRLPIGIERPRRRAHIWKDRHEEFDRVDDSLVAERSHGGEEDEVEEEGGGS